MSYCYDAPYSTSCPTTGAVGFLGRLTAVTNGNPTSLYTNFDALGRVLNQSQVTAGNRYNFAYLYNRAGALTSETYPLGRVVNSCYDGANRVSQVGVGGCGLQSAPAYASGIQYAPHGAPTQHVMGNLPPPPRAPSIVEMNGHRVSDPKVTLSAISIYLGSATVNVTSGDRDFVPKGGAKNSEHLQGKAADFHVIGVTDSKADTELKDAASPISDGFRLIQHGPDTQTQGAHLHLDSKNDDGTPTVFMHEGMTPEQKGAYAHDNQ